MTDRYPNVYEDSSSDSSFFWLQAASALDWEVAPSIGFDANAGGWFPDGRLNTCHNAVDRHVAAGHGDRMALVYDSAMTSEVRRFTFAELQDAVARTAGMLATEGVEKGDRVVIYMPMVPEAVFAMLACARLGAIHSVVFGGFAANELAKRIEDARPTVILSASCGLEPGRIVAYKPLLDAALEDSAHKIDRAIILQRPQLAARLEPGRDRDWAEAFARATPAPCVTVAATDPSYILYTSGTTGVPKGVVRDNGGHATALAWSMSNIYGAKPGEVFWAASDIGWVVGHSYIVYAPLLAGCTTILYEGKPVGTPDAGAFWRVVRDHQVDVLFTAPTALRAIKRDDPNGRHIEQDGIGGLRALFLAGERADPDTLAWAEARLQRPVIDHWWQTELGWPALATCLGLGDTETLHGSAGKAVPGYRFAILDADNEPLPAGTVGDITIALPLPPGCFPTLWNNHEGFVRSYLEAHPGYYTTGDAGFIDENGFVHVMSRIDDIINVAGHRLSTGAIEQIIAAHPDVAECAVVGAADAIKGMAPIGLFVMKAGVAREPGAIAAELVERVRDELGPVAAFKAAAPVAQLPKTRSGKVLRSTIRQIADGGTPQPPATIDDPSTLDKVRAALNSIGYG